VGFLQTNSTEGQGSDSLEAEDLYPLILERGVRFLRLILAFYRYGPAEARTAINKTPAAVVLKNNNRPRKRESIFALVQLAAPSNRLGRPPRQGAGGWLLTRIIREADSERRMLWSSSRFGCAIARAQGRFWWSVRRCGLRVLGCG
jgi:hypothetical protein